MLRTHGPIVLNNTIDCLQSNSILYVMQYPIGDYANKGIYNGNTQGFCPYKFYGKHVSSCVDITPT